MRDSGKVIYELIFKLSCGTTHGAKSWYIDPQRGVVIVVLAEGIIRERLSIL